jgi:hypothetical protein
LALQSSTEREGKAKVQEWKKNRAARWADSSAGEGPNCPDPVVTKEKR